MDVDPGGSLGEGAGQTTSTEFEWQTYDLRGNAQNTALEGADAGNGVSRVRANVSNVVQIHQSAVHVSYTKQAAVGQKAGSNNALPNPVTDEMLLKLANEPAFVAWTAAAIAEQRNETLARVATARARQTVNTRKIASVGEFPRQADGRVEPGLQLRHQGFSAQR